MAAASSHRRLVVERLTECFHAAAGEKNGTLIRFDIVEGLHKLNNQVGEEAVRETAHALITSETDAKYQKKYAALWRTK